MIGDIIPPRDRGRYQGLFGGVFGVATVIGPLPGGFFVDNLSWRWIFYVNLPIGVIAFAVIGATFHAPTERVQHAVDYLGAALLAGGLAAIVLLTSLGGNTYAWGSTQIVVLGIVGVTLLVLFPFVERRAQEPILPLSLFQDRIFVVSSSIGFIIGMALLSQLNVHTTTLETSLYVAVIGFGLGMVMQVLVLAVQNAVQPSVMGVATSGSIMFRQIGGSVGIAAFGAIFANRLRTELAKTLPPGVHGPESATPKAVRALSPHVHSLYVHAFSNALHPVFLVGAVISGLAFLLSWFLTEVPLRKTTEAAAVA